MKRQQPVHPPQPMTVTELTGETFVAAKLTAAVARAARYIDPVPSVTAEV